MQQTASAGTALMPPLVDAANGLPAMEIPTSDRRLRRQRREAADGESSPNPARQSSGGPELAARNSAQNPARRARRAARRDERLLPRAPLAEKSQSAPEKGAGAEDIEPSAATPKQAPQDLVVADAMSKGKRASRTVQRARKMQEAAADAVDAADDNPALGALNRHLNMLMQQLATAHRVIGRIAAERDALRQQLADLQGIPVDEIRVTAIGAGGEKSPKALATTEPASNSTSMSSWLTYFSAGEYAVMRRRRQMLAAALLALVFALWMATNVGWLPRLDEISRDSLRDIGILGNLMTFFLAGWLLYRVVRVSSKGIRWVFPSEDSRRKRR